jgi:outer membrane biosynthesis protein TonB
VVDALDLCYTKAHVNTFVIISGDSDFSPLVSKLRENAKYVIGVGVKNSTSDLLIANCDEFIFYDDLVREVRDSQRRQQARSNDGRDSKEAREAQPRRSPEEERKRKDETAARRAKAIDIASETFDALMGERGDGGKIWASVLKEAIKRRNPGFNENYFGFRTFGNLLEEAQAKGLLAFGRDEKSGAYVYRASADMMPASLSHTEHAHEGMQADQDAYAQAMDADAEPAFETQAEPAPSDQQRSARGGRGQARSGRESRGQRGGRGKSTAGSSPQAEQAPTQVAPTMRTERNERPERHEAPAHVPAPAPAPEPVQAAPKAEPQDKPVPAKKASRARASAGSATDTSPAPATAKRASTPRAPRAPRASKASKTPKPDTSDAG